MSAASGVTPLRRRDHALVAGVCVGLGRRLGVDPLLVRVAFVAAILAGGVGLPLYVFAWLLLRGDDPAPRMAFRGESWQVAGGIGLLVLAALLLFRELGLWFFSDAIVWPVVLAAAGGALIWRQSGHAATAAAPVPALLRPTEPVAAPGRRVLAPLGGSALGRLAIGVGLVLAAALIFLRLNDALRPARDVVLAVLVLLITLGLILAPWWVRLVGNLTAERAERIRSQERAELAAHLHDSVLQTLALVQRRADDPREVATLARRQERELRAWLNSGRALGTPAGVAAALEVAAAEVEADHHVRVEVVAVGDAPLDARGEAVVAAAREALVNAAKFAGDAAGAPISVYAEVTDDALRVYVRDRGPGFDLAAVPADRRGVRESIVGRMERHGGRAVVHAAPGAGTEVELVLEGGSSR